MESGPNFGLDQWKGRLNTICKYWDKKLRFVYNALHSSLVESLNALGTTPMVSPSRDMIRSSDDWTWNELKTERKGRKGGQNNQELD